MQRKRQVWWRLQKDSDTRAVCVYTWGNIKVNHCCSHCGRINKFVCFPHFTLLTIGLSGGYQRWVDEPRLPLPSSSLIWKKKHLFFNTKLPCDSWISSAGNDWAESLTCSGPAPATSYTVCPSDWWKKHDDMSKAAGHVPSTSLRRGGGPVCVALILRKAKHRRPNIAKQWSNGMDGERKRESLRDVLCVKEEEEERGEEMSLCFLSF